MDQYYQMYGFYLNTKAENWVMPSIFDGFRSMIAKTRSMTLSIYAFEAIYSNNDVK